MKTNKKAAPYGNGNHIQFKDSEKKHLPAILALIMHQALTEREISVQLGIDIKSMNFYIGDLRDRNLIFEGGKRLCTVSTSFLRPVKTWTSNFHLAVGPDKDQTRLVVDKNGRLCQSTLIEDIFKQQLGGKCHGRG